MLDGRPLVCGLLVVRSGHPWPRNIFDCTFGSSEPVFGCWICSSCTTGTSTVLSVNFHSFLCLLRCWHLHQDCDFLHSVKEWNMWLSLCFLRGSNWWELGGCDVPQLAHQRTCHCIVPGQLRLLKPVGTCLCTFTEMLTTLSMNCTLIISTFFLTVRTAGTCLCITTGD